jgi:hypothetical protein
VISGPRAWRGERRRDDYQSLTQPPDCGAHQ